MQKQEPTQNKKICTSCAARKEEDEAEKHVFTVNSYGPRDRVYGYFDQYTGFFEDLIDNNTAYAARAYLGTGRDNVQGYSIKQIETCLILFRLVTQYNIGIIPSEMLLLVLLALLLNQ